MKRLLFIITFAVSMAALADQLTVLVTYESSTEIDETTGVTNVTHRYTFSAPQTVGQLQDAVSYTQSNAPSSLTISNDIVPRVQQMLGWLGKTENTVIVVLP